MPQLVKGGKWVFGWVIVGAGGEVLIPLAAFAEYDFRPGETVLITCGSRRSGGFGIGRQEKLENSPLQSRFIGQAVVGADERVMLPVAAGIRPGERLLAVRGSGLALGFLQRGPIVEEALKHTEIETFVSDRELF